MTNLSSDNQFRNFALRFFDEACAALCRSIDDAKAAMAKQSGIRIHGDVVFSYSQGLYEAQFDLQRYCVKKLGPRIITGKEIEEEAWNAVIAEIQAASSNPSAKNFIAALGKALASSTTIEREYVRPNYAIRFRSGQDEIAVGPVRAILTEKLIKEIPHRAAIRNDLLTVGQDFEFDFAARNPTFRLPPTSWNVRVRATRGLIEQEATWLINVAISLLRLAYPDAPYEYFPRIGDLETNPVERPTFRDQGLTLESGTLYGGGWSAPHFYVIDAAVVRLTSEDPFVSAVSAIFPAKRETLAERFAHGLGWLSRGRQSEDASERLLYFFTAIEALLSSSDKSPPVTQTIARHAAAILEDDPAQREKLYENISELYGMRSQLVHRGQRESSGEQVSMTQMIAEALFRAVLHKCKLTVTFAEFNRSLVSASFGAVWSPPT